jgi:hypothetical protein
MTHRLTRRLATIGALTAFATGMAVSPAHAAFEHCSVNGYLNPPFQSCTTSYPVQATPQGWLDVDVWPYGGCTARYKVFDARNQQVINSGSTTGVSKRLYGVHSWYHITMTLPGWRCGGEASLDNEPG